ncbi:gamma-glutamylcyclotransferase family protein [Qaidamihabitans albus]|uniref:gamma-glutamylcyclotransferase family protein n=1 Tax=Qaidamihabitans albus TaxID=2795733 RepID=UPI0018F13853|nr:gamma-glutamylcyclotransferase family protein [Qaidamihabitans albus]
MHLDGAGHPLSTAPAGWRSERVPVLAYGSNVCPAKITWLRETLDLTGPAVVVRAECHDVAAVWSAGLRGRDGQRPATLAAAPGVTEWHAVWFATPEQLAVLDRCEARGTHYDLARLHSGKVVLEDGTVVPDVLAYVGAGPSRMPLLVDGQAVRTAELPQHEALALAGVPARSHGLDVTILDPAAPPRECAREF